ncbi:SgcJ/EcaC family oxidoreductase [Tundrisphaera lichenicola]|uniref:SgcJ/EcaC family oxidoreductase n=1 Tax=Tundrisphaera lichenicola TaxID=2029860 RepID=UPI003EBF9395
MRRSDSGSPGTSHPLHNQNGFLMSIRCGIRAVVPPTTLLILCLCPFAFSMQPAGDDPSDSSRAADERAIRELDDVFVREYNKGDSKALTALFTEDAEVVEADESRDRGRGPIEESFSQTFAGSPGSKIKFEIDSIRFLGKEVAKEDGRAIVTPVRGSPRSTVYSVLYVKRDDRWLISSVREEADPNTSPRDHLKDLEWMVGDWIDEGSDSEVRVHCDWSEDGCFLMRVFTVHERGKPVFSATQRIGWDPLVRQIRSWEFDSKGGFGEGRWGGVGDHWVIKHTAVQPEGTTASATNILTLVRADHIRWTSVDRSVGGTLIPDEVTYSLVRTPPPAPDTRVDPKAPNNNPERSQ